MRRKKCSLSVAILLVLTIFFDIVTPTNFKVNAATAHSVDEALTWATSQVGKSLDYDGAYGAQCVDLIAYYYAYLGAKTPGGNAIDYATNKLPSGWTRVYNGYRPGDIAVYHANYNDGTYSTGGYGHVAIIEQVNSSYLYVIDQNGYRNKGYCQNGNKAPLGIIKCAIRPDFGSATNTVNSWVKNTGVTSITETTARINAAVSPGANVTEIGFYLGTSPSSMTKVVESVSAYAESIWYDLGTGKWTGALNRGTTYYYQIYAVIGGVTYTTAVDSFTTTGDSQPPVISNCYVTDVSDNGYSVVCVVTDNVAMDRVSFPTWTEANGQDDLATDWYNQTAILKQYANGNTYTFRVLKSNHGNQTGIYNTHVYAYDTSGNYTMVAVQCGIYPLQSISLSKSSATLSVGNSTQLTVNYNPTNTTTSKSISWTSSNTKVAKVDSSGKITAVSAGKATITANVAGKTAQCTVTVKSAEDANLTAFVERMYTVALGRTADASGVSYWKNQLKSYQADGAGIARGFILSPEFINKGYSNSKYIEILYKTFFDRTADADGLSYWTKALNSGQSREFVLSGFVNSNEFNTICANYGISRGYMQSNGVAINPGICRFSERLYTKVLGRAGEKEGIEYWAIQISGGACTPEAAAQGFFTSSEYKAKKTSNDAYIKALYATFMDRTPDASGLSYWKDVLNSGTSREAVLSGFANSPEFKQIMQSYGL